MQRLGATTSLWFFGAKTWTVFFSLPYGMYFSCEQLGSVLCIHIKLASYFASMFGPRFELMFYRCVVAVLASIVIIARFVRTIGSNINFALSKICDLQSTSPKLKRIWTSGAIRTSEHLIYYLLIVYCSIVFIYYLIIIYCCNCSTFPYLLRACYFTARWRLVQNH